jgi:hypothetical protein
MTPWHNDTQSKAHFTLAGLSRAIARCNLGDGNLGDGKCEMAFVAFVGGLSGLQDGLIYMVPPPLAVVRMLLNGG